MADDFKNNDEFLAEMERRRMSAQSQELGTEAVNYAARAERPATQETGIIGFLIRYRMAKDASQANLILIGVVVVVLGITAWVLWG